MTGINMLVFYNTIANGGVQMQPRIVKAVLKDGEIYKASKPASVPTVLSGRLITPPST